ncbi:MAG: PSD1 domain-containing protein, partial [Candidatus Solibacter usitatus]|nr:PSD1 domain-containing protein [Candidatus Solibacter usitatus]
AQEKPESLAVFDAQVRPILKNNCLPCHNAKNRTSGLALDTRDGILSGGNRGAVVKPGNAAESLLIQAVEQKGDLKMPPTGRLSPEQVASLRRWVDLGLPWPEEKPVSRNPGADHWAFQPVKRHAAPVVKDAAFVRNPIDNFILERLEREGLTPAPEADRYSLIRRASLDLIGLPPSPQEVREFLADSHPDAYERLVDRLLTSPHYGERWGRHWLDVARYADSDGYTIDAPRQIWKYRDWVIQALNRDLPFDQFVIEQLAGDLLPNPTVDQLIATGFHRNTTSNYEGGIDFEQYRVEAVVDRVATTGAAFLGLTLGCARCHDHKYDPIAQREFYQLFAYLNNADEIASEAERYDFNRPILEIPTPEEIARREAYRAQVSALSKELIGYVRTLAARPGADPKQDAGLRERMGNLRALRQRQPKITTTLVMRELPQPRETHIHLGGDFLRKGAAVKPGVPAVLPQLPPERTTRLDLARWLVDARNPLTPRVTVNRMWQSYFGKGIVETENDFGTQGAPPSHPELLDWLAGEFVRQGWSQKAMHRLIATSATYRQSSRQRSDLEAKDPRNKLLGRQSRLRLDAEIVRDSALTSSGLLNPALGGPSVYPPIPEGAMAVTQVKRDWPTATGPDRYRRGLYTFFLRSAPHPGLVVFDAPDGTAACTRRVRSNTPLQALTLLNDDASVEFAQALARRILKEAPSGDRERVEYGCLLAIGREPKSADRDRLERFLATQLDEFRTHPEAARQLIPEPPEDAKDLAQLAAWTALSRVLLNVDEFLTRE